MCVVVIPLCNAGPVPLPRPRDISYLGVVQCVKLGSQLPPWLKCLILLGDKLPPHGTRVPSWWPLGFCNSHASQDLCQFKDRAAPGATERKLCKPAYQMLLARDLRGPQPPRDMGVIAARAVPNQGPCRPWGQPRTVPVAPGALWPTAPNRKSVRWLNKDCGCNEPYVRV